MCYGVLSHYALRTDRAVAMPLVGRFCCLTDDVSTAVRELALIERERPKMFCLNNDCQRGEETFRRSSRLLERYLPRPSSFEKQAGVRSPQTPLSL